MIGGVAVREAPDSMFYVMPLNGSNTSAILDVEARDARRVQVAVVLTTLVGIIQVSLKEPKHYSKVILQTQSSHALEITVYPKQQDHFCDINTSI